MPVGIMRHMSGICAVASFDGAPIPPTDLDRMMERGVHRGRHGSGTWRGPRAAVGQLTTWAVPEPGHRTGPLVQGEMAVAVDGRIDNGPELVPLLRQRGYLAGDDVAGPVAELVLAAYRCWGDQAPSRLIGDFAFVIWDGLLGRLVAGRDPMGMRPLYHHLGPGRRIVVASEIVQLLEARGVPRAIDERSIAATLAGPYLPPDATMYAGIGQVAPGHVLVADAGGSRSLPYWRPDPSTVLEGVDPLDCVDQFRDTFALAVADRARTGRAGLSLSGGIDSGSVAATVGWLAGRTGHTDGLRTYTWSFGDLPGGDEQGAARALADHYGFEARSVIVDRPWPLGHPEAGPDADDAFHWPYQALQDRTVELAAHDGVGVMLYGDRGDELLGDWVYDEIGLLRAGRVRTAARDLRLALRDDDRAMVRLLRAALPRPALYALARGRRRLSGRPAPGPRAAPWIPSEVARRTDLEAMIRAQTTPPPFDGMARSARHQRIFAPQGARIAALAERRHAAHGLTAADPYADRRLLELVLALPQWLVQTRARPKRLLHEAMRGVMPDEARRRATKRIPAELYDRGLREREVQTVRSLLTGSRAAANGWLVEAKARDAFERYVTSGQAQGDLWWVITVETWLRRWWS